MWADRPRHALLRRMGWPPRTPAGLLLSSLLASLLTAAVAVALVQAPDPARAALVIGLALVVVVLAAVLAWHRPARAIYAATDRGRGLVARGAEVLVFVLPAGLEVHASADLETGDLDLGTLPVVVHPGGRAERRAVRLYAVAYPCVVADLLRGLAPSTIPA